MEARNGLRNSSIELLRVVCMFGIISMHIFGEFLATCTGINLLYAVAINSIFNMGVTIFMLITGYYGAIFSVKRIVHLESMMIIYSLLDLLVSGFSVWGLVRACFPTATKRYWYMSCYMIILCLAGYINQIPEKLNRKGLKTLILLLSLFFYIMPTLLHGEIMSDSGKGIANMFTVYLIGRYIRKYHDEKKSASRLLGIAFVILLAEFLGNIVFSYLKNAGVGMSSPWARDNSLFILSAAVCVFLAFKSMEFHSKAINILAGTVFATYLCEGTVRAIVRNYVELTSYANSSALPFVCTGCVVLIMTICFLIEVVRKNTIGKMEAYICNFIIGIRNKFCRRYQGSFDKW